MSNTTTIDLMLYLFNETAITETVTVQSEIENNYLIHEQFEELKNTFACLDKVDILPSQSAVNAIKAYSELTATLQKVS